MGEALEKTAISADVTALTNFGDWSYAVTGVSSCHSICKFWMKKIPRIVILYKQKQKILLQKTAVSVVKSRLALGSPGWLFGQGVCSFVTIQKIKIHRKWLLTTPS